MVFWTGCWCIIGLFITCWVWIGALLRTGVLTIVCCGLTIVCCGLMIVCILWLETVCKGFTIVCGLLTMVWLFCGGTNV